MKLKNDGEMLLPSVLNGQLLPCLISNRSNLLAARNNVITYIRLANDNN